METGKKYRFSFTAGSFLFAEMKLIIDPIVGDGVDANHLDAVSFDGNSKTSTKREFEELKVVVAQFSERVFRYFFGANEKAQLQLAWIAVLSSYQFFQDFFFHVVSEKLETSDYSTVEKEDNKSIQSVELTIIANG